jgi:hypothetical protein
MAAQAAASLMEEEAVVKPAAAGFAARSLTQDIEPALSVGYRLS